MHDLHFTDGKRCFTKLTYWDILSFGLYIAGISFVALLHSYFSTSLVFYWEVTLMIGT